VIVRHQRVSASNKGFRHLAHYVRGRSDKPRATWFLAANLPGVIGPADLQLACRPVEAVHAQNTRAGNNRTYQMVISLHPADHEAHHGIDSFARWARKELGPALRAVQVRSWDDVHDVCASLGVVLRPHGNGLVFEDVEQGVRVKASFVGRKLSKPRLCQRFRAFHPAPAHQLEAARTATRRYSPAPPIAKQGLWKEYEQSLM
jgi:hypothetical protein